MVPCKVASCFEVCHGSNNLQPGPELDASLASILSWCSATLQSIFTPVVGRILVTTSPPDLSMAFGVFLPELIERTVKYRSNPLMGSQPPSEPFQETPSRRIANPLGPGRVPDPLLGFRSLRHMSARGAVTSGFQPAPGPTRRVWLPSPRALALLAYWPFFRPERPWDCSASRH